jgi:nucleotide-binding universal stress UspA family protein
MLYVVHVVKPKKKTSMVVSEDTLDTSPQPENMFGAFKYEYVLVEKEDVVDGIIEAIEKLQADLLVMVPHKHDIWDRLMSKSNTAKMAFQTHTPLLALPHK